jgi:hypothetical protein
MMKGVFGMTSSRVPANAASAAKFGVFYLALGVATVAWGRLEGHFVTCLMTAIQIAKKTSDLASVLNVEKRRTEFVSPSPLVT